MSTNRVALMCSGEARPRSRKKVGHHVQRGIEVLNQPCQGFRQTVESLLSESKILDDGLGRVRPPFSLVVREKVLDNARVASGFCQRILVPQKSIQ